MKKYILFIGLIIAYASCSDSNISVVSEDLVGEWRSENTMINSKPASEYLNGSTFYSSILGLRETGFYFFNYSSGNWSLEGNILHLENRGDFEIVYYADSLMTLRIELSASELYWPLEGIEANESIVLQEDYRRH